MLSLLVPVWPCLALLRPARVATGTISEMALTWNARILGLGYYHHVVPRAFFLVVAAVFSGSTLGVGSPLSRIFVVGVVLSGIAFGMV
jgi:hypothetical protein